MRKPLPDIPTRLEGPMRRRVIDCPLSSFDDLEPERTRAWVPELDAPRRELDL